MKCPEPIARRSGMPLADILNHRGLIFYAVAAALALRIGFFPIETRDYLAFLAPWYSYLIDYGRFAAFKYDFYNYAPPYLYLLSFATLLGLKPIFAIKLISVVFELLLASVAFKVVRHLRPIGVAANATFISVLFFPTVILNGSVWGQCDAIHTSLILLAIYYFIRNQMLAGCLSYGLAFAFKLQTVFLFPLVVLLVACRRLSPFHLMAMPAPCLLSFIPCLLAGRSLSNLSTIYLRQAGEYQELTLHAPNIYQWLPDQAPGLGTAGLVGAVVITGLVIMMLIRAQKDRLASFPADIVQWGLLFALLGPFLLPRMHERYFYIADVLAIIYAALYPKLWYVPFMVGGASLVCYSPYLAGTAPVPLSYAACAMAGALFIVSLNAFRGQKCTRSFPVAQAAAPTASS